jgi:hypothetical protein
MAPSLALCEWWIYHAHESIKRDIPPVEEKNPTSPYLKKNYFVFWKPKKFYSSSRLFPYSHSTLQLSYTITTDDLNFPDGLQHVVLLVIKCCWHVGLHTLMALVCVTRVSIGYNKQRSASVHNGRSRRAIRWAYTSPPPPLPQSHSTHKSHQAVTLRSYIIKFSARNSAGKLNLLFLVFFNLSNHIQRHLVSQISPRPPSSPFSSIHNSVFLVSYLSKYTERNSFIADLGIEDVTACRVECRFSVW